MAGLVSIFEIVPSLAGGGKSTSFGGGRYSSSAAHERYRVDQDTCILVRPDDYVACRASPPSLEAIQAYFRNLLGRVATRSIQRQPAATMQAAAPATMLNT